MSNRYSVAGKRGGMLTPLALSLYGKTMNSTAILFPQTLIKNSTTQFHGFGSNPSIQLNSIFDSTLKSANSSSPFTVHCSRSSNSDRRIESESDSSYSSSAYEVLGVSPNCSPSDLKAAFRSKVNIYMETLLIQLNNGVFDFWD